jgi:hypothetical protein
MTIEKPPNYLPRIGSIWAVLSVDEGGEGLVAAPLAPGMLSVPLIAADETRLTQITQIARMMSRVSKKPMRVVKFTTREDIGEIEP